MNGRCRQRAEHERCGAHATRPPIWHHRTRMKNWLLVLSSEVLCVLPGAAIALFPPGYDSHDRVTYDFGPNHELVGAFLNFIGTIALVTSSRQLERSQRDRRSRNE